MESEHNKERYDCQVSESQKLRDELNQVKQSEMANARKVAQLEAQASSDSVVRESLSFREQVFNPKSSVFT